MVQLGAAKVESDWYPKFDERRNLVREFVRAAL